MKFTNYLDDDEETAVETGHTYTTLTALADAGGLTVGRRYQLTYIGRGYMPGAWGVVFEGTPETLQLTAETTSTFSPFASSIENPDDIIMYRLSNSYYSDGQSQTGTITYREYVPRQIKAGFDFRAVKCRCWERIPGSGIYSGFWDPGGGLAYQDFPVFPAGMLVPPGTPSPFDFGAVELNLHRRGDNGYWRWPFNVFRSSVYRVKAGYGNDQILCIGGVETANFGCCAPVACEGNITNYSSSDGVSIGHITGSLMDVVVNKNVTKCLGSLSGCRIDPTFVNFGFINGDHTNTVFGGTTDGPGLLGPEQCADHGGNLPSFWLPSGPSVTVAGGQFVGTACAGATLTDTESLYIVDQRSVWVETYIDSIAAASSITISVGGATSAAFSTVGLHRELIACTTNAGLVLTFEGTLSAGYVSVKTQD